MRYTFKEIAEKLAQDVERVARELLPQGKRQGQEWCVGSITGEKGESLKVHLSGAKAGVWYDFATSEGGDLLELWRQVKNLSHLEALEDAKHWLGIKDDIPNFYKLSPAKTFTKPEQKEYKTKPDSKVFTYLTKERKLAIQTLQDYKIGEYQAKDKEGKLQDVMAFPYIRNGETILYKNICLDRPNGKKIMWTSKGSEPCLFGWHMVTQDARCLAIFEGEIDAMTGHQYQITRLNPLTKTKEPIGMLSVPIGGGGGKKQEWVEYEFERLAVYDEIYLVLDADEAGDEACKELITRLGRHRCLVVSLPYKDINECLQKGLSQEEIQKCFDRAKTLDPQELVSIAKYTEKIKEQFALSDSSGEENSISSSRLGYLPPWKIEDSDLRFKPSELSVWTGFNGHGKSQLLGHVLLSCINDGAKVCIASLEMKPYKLGQRLYRQASGKVTLTHTEIDVLSHHLEQKLYLFDHVGEINIDKLLDIFAYAHSRYGVDVFVIDSLMKCEMVGEDYLQAQKSFLDKLCNFKNKYDCHVHLVAHPRKDKDENSPPGKMDIKGSGDITDLVDNCFSVWRNIPKEQKLQSKDLKESERKDLEQAADCLFKCLKRRDGEWSGEKWLWFDKESLQYHDGFNQQPLPLLDIEDKKPDPEEYEYGEICDL